MTGQRCPLCAWLLGMANDVIELTYELVMLDRLRDQGKITEEEHVQHRARILGEL